MIERVVIEVENPKVIRFKMPPDQHRTTLCDDISCNGDFSDVEWSADATKSLSFHPRATTNERICASQTRRPARFEM
jgi:hypothetical protein